MKSQEFRFAFRVLGSRFQCFRFPCRWFRRHSDFTEGCRSEFVRSCLRQLETVTERSPSF